jgi:hypothetical protein
VTKGNPIVKDFFSTGTGIATIIAILFARSFVRNRWAQSDTDLEDAKTTSRADSVTPAKAEVQDPRFRRDRIALVN